MTSVKVKDIKKLHLQHCCLKALMKVRVKISDIPAYLIKHDHKQILQNQNPIQIKKIIILVLFPFRSEDQPSGQYHAERQRPKIGTETIVPEIKTTIQHNRPAIPGKRGKHSFRPRLRQWFLSPNCLSSNKSRISKGTAIAAINKNRLAIKMVVSRKEMLARCMACASSIGSNTQLMVHTRVIINNFNPGILRKPNFCSPMVNRGRP